MKLRQLRSTSAFIVAASFGWSGAAMAEAVDFAALAEACQAAIIADGADIATLTLERLVFAEDGSCVILALEEVAIEPETELAVEPEAIVEPEAAEMVEPAPEPEAIAEEIAPEEVAPVEAEPVVEEAVAEEPVAEEVVVEEPATEEMAEEKIAVEEPVMEAEEPVVEDPEEVLATEPESIAEFSFLSLSDECQAVIIADGTLDIPSLSPDQLVIAEDGTCEVVPLELAEPVVEPEIVVEVAPPAAAAEVVDDPDAESTSAVEVVSEIVTEETTRSSDEEVAEAAADRKKANNNNDTRDLAKILGAVGVGIVIGTLLDNNDTVVGDTGDRVIVERDGRYIVRNDENELLRRPGSDIRTEEFSDGSTRTIVTRDDGIRIVTIRDSYGYVVRRTRFMPDGSEFVLFDDSVYDDEVITSRDLPRISDEPAYEDYSAIDEDELLRALQAAELRDNERSYSLRQIRENEQLRAALPRVDLDVITFDSGSAALTSDQAKSLTSLGRVMARMIEDNPGEVFLIEGHTDAVGSEISNLALSDRRAETVALALTEYFGVPPENLIVQGYGEEFLKVPTLGDERANRRTAVRRITNLLRT